MPQISIFIPLYNSEKFISNTIQSVLSQTFIDWELIIIDDCSVDRSFELAKAFELKDTRIKVLKNEFNLGMLLNWNKGIEMCHSPYFVKLDSDDLWHPSFLDQSLKIMMEHPEVGLVFTKYVNIDTTGLIMPDTGFSLPDFAKNKPFDTISLVQRGEDKMLSFQILRQGLSLIRSEVFKKIGSYRFLLTPKTQASTDTEFYFRAGCNYKIYCIDQTLYYYRVHKRSISQTDTDEGLSAQKIYEVKNCILRYYYEQGKITNTFLKRQLKKIELQYNFVRSYQYRAQRKYCISLKLMLRNFYLSPLSTIKFYLSRL